MQITTIIVKKSLEAKVLNFLKSIQVENIFVTYAKGMAKNIFCLGDETKSCISFSCHSTNELDEFLKSEIRLEEKNTGIKFEFGEVKQQMKTKFEAVITIINEGYSDTVMEIARANGVTGGSIIQGKGTGDKQQSFLGMNIDSGKEVIINIVPKTISANVVEKIVQYVTENKTVSGICFAFPISNFMGINVDA